MYLCQCWNQAHSQTPSFFACSMSIVHEYSTNSMNVRPVLVTSRLQVSHWLSEEEEGEGYSMGSVSPLTPSPTQKVASTALMKQRSTSGRSGNSIFRRRISITSSSSGAGVGGGGDELQADLRDSTIKAAHYEAVKEGLDTRFHHGKEESARERDDTHHRHPTPLYVSDTLPLNDTSTVCACSCPRISDQRPMATRGHASSTSGIMNDTSGNRSTLGGGTASSPLSSSLLLSAEEKGRGAVKSDCTMCSHCAPNAKKMRESYKLMTVRLLKEIERLEVLQRSSQRQLLSLLAQSASQGKVCGSEHQNVRYMHTGAPSVSTTRLKGDSLPTVYHVPPIHPAAMMISAAPLKAPHEHQRLFSPSSRTHATPSNIFAQSLLSRPPLPHPHQHQQYQQQSQQKGGYDQPHALSVQAQRNNNILLHHRHDRSAAVATEDITDNTTAVADSALVATLHLLVTRLGAELDETKATLHHHLAHTASPVRARSAPSPDYRYHHHRRYRSSDNTSSGRNSKHKGTSAKKLRKSTVADAQHRICVGERVSEGRGSKSSIQGISQSSARAGRRSGSAGVDDHPFTKTADATLCSSSYSFMSDYDTEPRGKKSSTQHNLSRMRGSADTAASGVGTHRAYARLSKRHSDKMTASQNTTVNTSENSHRTFSPSVRESAIAAARSATTITSALSSSVNFNTTALTAAGATTVATSSLSHHSHSREGMPSRLSNSNISLNTTNSSARQRQRGSEGKRKKVREGSAEKRREAARGDVRVDATAASRQDRTSSRDSSLLLSLLYPAKPKNQGATQTPIRKGDHSEVDWPMHLSASASPVFQSLLEEWSRSSQVTPIFAAVGTTTTCCGTFFGEGGGVTEKDKNDDLSCKEDHDHPPHGLSRGKVVACDDRLAKLEARMRASEDRLDAMSGLLSETLAPFHNVMEKFMTDTTLCSTVEKSSST